MSRDTRNLPTTDEHFSLKDNEDYGYVYAEYNSMMAMKLSLSLFFTIAAVLFTITTAILEFAFYESTFSIAVASLAILFALICLWQMVHAAIIKLRLLPKRDVVGSVMLVVLLLCLTTSIIWVNTYTIREALHG